MGGLRTVTVLIALALIAQAFAPAPARASELFGVSVNHIIADDPDPSHWDAALAAVSAGGIHVARMDATWAVAEPAAPFLSTHTFDWTRHDAIATALAQHGLRWLPVLDYSAPWAATIERDVLSPPKSNDDYATYAGAFASRYGRGGSFWAEHPELPALPVTDYEIWNEPNGAWFWHHKPNPVQYGAMYVKARAAIRAADPYAKAVVGGITNDVGFVQDMYNGNPGLKGHVDAVGWHPYGANATAVIDNIRAARSVLDGLGDPNVPLYVTELGWPTRGKGFAYVLDEPARGVAMQRAADTLSRSDCGITKIVAYTWTTREQQPDFVEDWYGLIHPDGTASPSGAAFLRTVARWGDEPVPTASRLYICHDGPPAPGPHVVDAPGQPSPTGGPPRARPEGLRFLVTPFRDGSGAYRFKATGKLVRPAGMHPAKGCTGSVRVRYAPVSGGRPISSRHARLRADCSYRLVTVVRNRRRLPSSGKLIVRARFLGNASLAPLSARARHVHAAA
jgi:hypothetical protein